LKDELVALQLAEAQTRAVAATREKAA
jgi:hypothetical protein